ncbi:hypothetical protein V502_03558 [Pseudogymnoascus sp. VKM F-4520 (FW-2644)]|nr:hypothetical protein V502_03558 [Pseudogymnoascus sp. VKM F-4520 (FW-2644)]
MASTAISRTTSWLPVTTAFSALAACSSIIWGAHAPWLALNDPGYGLSVDPNLTCLPPPATTWWQQDNPSIEYSIGPTIVCPQAYTTATTSVHDSSTFVACCPSNYALNTVADHGAAVQCQSFMEAGDVVTIVDYKTFTSNNVLNSAWVTAVSTATGNVVVDGIQMNGWIFSSSTTYSSSTSTSTGSGSTSATSASSGTFAPTNTSPITPSTLGPTESPASTSEPTSEGLSSGTKIGLGVGVAGCLLAIGMLVTCLVCLRRKGRVDKDTEWFASNVPRLRASIFSWGRHEMPASPNEKPLPPYWHEVSGMKSPTEISGIERPLELPSQRWSRGMKSPTEISRIEHPVELPSQRWSRGM